MLARFCREWRSVRAWEQKARVQPPYKQRILAEFGRYTYERRVLARLRNDGFLIQITMQRSVSESTLGYLTDRKLSRQDHSAEWGITKEPGLAPPTSTDNGL